MIEFKPTISQLMKPCLKQPKFHINTTYSWVNTEYVHPQTSRSRVTGCQYHYGNSKARVYARCFDNPMDNIKVISLDPTSWNLSDYKILADSQRSHTTVD